LPESDDPADLPDLADLAPVVPPERTEPVNTVESSPPQPGRRYGAGRQELRPIVGWDHGSQSGRFQLGLRGGDVLGRGQWLLLGGAGSDAGPEGLALSGTWNGWPVTVGAHLYRTEERPSSYRDPNPDIGTGLDLRRKGIEIRAGWKRLWNRSRIDMALAGLGEALKPIGGGELGRRIVAATAGWNGGRRYRSYRLSGSVQVSAAIGETDGTSWERRSGQVRLEWGKGWWKRVRIGFRRSRTNDAVAPWDRLQLGGMESSLLPETLHGNRELEPALPADHRIGDDYEGRELSLGPLFYRDHQVRDESGATGDRLAVAGLEIGFGSGPLPVLRLPGLRIRAGAGRVLDGSLEGDNRLWVYMVWRP
jgi:hypothetical protein